MLGELQNWGSGKLKLTKEIEANFFQVTAGFDSLLNREGGLVTEMKLLVALAGVLSMLSMLPASDGATSGKNQSQGKMAGQGGP